MTAITGPGTVPEPSEHDDDPRIEVSARTIGGAAGVLALIGELAAALEGALAFEGISTGRGLARHWRPAAVTR